MRDKETNGETGLPVFTIHRRDLRRKTAVLYSIVLRHRGSKQAAFKLRQRRSIYHYVNQIRYELHGSW